jgi:hypothetical protein
MSPLITVAELFQFGAAWLQLSASYVANIALALALTLLLLRFLFDRFDVNPFGRLAFYVRRLTNPWFYGLKSSQFYQPLRQAFGFDPIYLLLLLAFVLFFFLLRGLVDYVVIMLNCVAITFKYFGLGNALAGGQALIGTVLLGLIYFLMALMTILVIHSWFGLFRQAAFWAGRRIYPLLYSFDRSGKIGPLIFILAFFLLSLLAAAVQSAFF